MGKKNTKTTANSGVTENTPDMGKSPNVCCMYGKAALENS